MSDGARPAAAQISPAPDQDLEILTDRKPTLVMDLLFSYLHFLVHDRLVFHLMRLSAPLFNGNNSIDTRALLLSVTSKVVSAPFHPQDSLLLSDR